MTTYYALSENEILYEITLFLSYTFDACSGASASKFGYIEIRKILAFNKNLYIL